LLDKGTTKTIRSFPCKKEPRIPGVKFLASILGFFAHAEKLGKGPEKRSWLSRNSWKSLESKEEIKFPHFQSFSLCVKTTGASDKKDFWHSLALP